MTGSVHRPNHDRILDKQLSIHSTKTAHYRYFPDLLPSFLPLIKPWSNHTHRMSSATTMLKRRPEVVFDQELPELEEAKRRVRLSQKNPSRDDDRGTCSHLRTILPTHLKLEFVEGTKGIFLRDPIHAMHLQSQFDRNESIQDWILYGEEHEKSIAMQTAGFSESWHNELQHNEYSSNATAKSSPEKAEPDGSKSAAVPPAKPVSLVLSGPAKDVPHAATQPKLPTTTNKNATTSTTSSLVSATAVNREESQPSSTTASIKAMAVPSSSTEPSVHPPGVATTHQRPPSPEYLLPDSVYQAYAAEEQRIRSVRRRTGSSIKRAKLLAPDVSRQPIDRDDYLRAQQSATTQLIVYLQYFRQSRFRYWNATRGKPPAPAFGSLSTTTATRGPRCTVCHSQPQDWDNLLQCLQCAHIGLLGGSNHSYEHWLATGHDYGMLCSWNPCTQILKLCCTQPYRAGLKQTYIASAVDRLFRTVSSPKNVIASTFAAICRG